MSEAKGNADSTQELLSRHLDGSPASDDYAALVKRLHQDAELRDAWVAQVAIDSLLSRQSRVQHQDALKVRVQGLAQVEMQRRRRRRRLLYATFGLGGGLAALLLLAVLPALLLPSIQASREAARKASSSNNLKEVALALHQFHDKHHAFPTSHSTDSAGKALLSWRVFLLPHLGEQALFEKFRLDEPWNSQHNLALLDEMPAVYQSPLAASDSKTVYLAIPSRLGVMGPPAASEDGATPALGVSLQDVIDGTSHTALVVEVSASLAVPWSSPQDYPLEADLVEKSSGPVIAALKAWKSEQRIRCVRAAFVDLSVRETADGVPRAAVTISGGESNADLWSN